MSRGRGRRGADPAVSLLAVVLGAAVLLIVLAFVVIFLWDAMLDELGDFP